MKFQIFQRIKCEISNILLQGLSVKFLMFPRIKCENSYISKDRV